MTARPDDDQPRRGLGLTEAARYIGVAPPAFTALVERGLMPKPRLINDRRIWDRREIDIWFEALPYDERTADQRTPRARRLLPSNPAAPHD
jgi:hypothetical protein